MNDTEFRLEQALEREKKLQAENERQAEILEKIEEIARQALKASK